MMCLFPLFLGQSNILCRPSHWYVNLNTSRLLDQIKSYKNRVQTFLPQNTEIQYALLHVHAFSHPLDNEGKQRDSVPRVQY